MATRAKVRTEEFLNSLYAAAQRLDEWPGEDYNGTSVRAGAKVLAGQGRIVEYLWGASVAELRQFVLSRGTVVVGSDWHEEMFFPENHGGYLKLEGPVAGGHAWLVIGYNATKKAFRVLNSWGPDWGDNGKAWISEEDMETLCGRGAEMCSAIEKRAPKA